MDHYDDLYHSGVIGMHWGQRRYQNEDGSYKPGAEGRYYTPVSKKEQKDLYKYLKRRERGLSSHTTVTKDRTLDKQLDKVMTEDDKKKLVELLKEKDKLMADYEKVNDKYLDVDHPKYVEAVEKYDKVNDQYTEAVQSYVDEVLGKYGEKKVKTADKQKFKAQNVVNAYIQNHAIDEAYKSQRIKRQLDDAKNNDSYDMLFLEIIQNKKVLSQGGKPLLNEYKKYLNDPEGYWDKADRLEDY